MKTYVNSWLIWVKGKCELLVLLQLLCKYEVIKIKSYKEKEVYLR